MSRPPMATPSGTRRKSVVIGSASSDHPDLIAAAGEAAAGALTSIGDAEVDLAVVFHTPASAETAAGIAETVSRAARPRVLMGSSTEAVVEGDREMEQRRAAAVWLAHLGPASVVPFSISVEAEADRLMVSGLPVFGLEERASQGLPPIEGTPKAMLLLADPFSFPPEILQRIEEERPGLPVIGGMAGGGSGPGENLLMLDGRVQTLGAVGAVISGPVTLDAVVSQGCRPIGRPYVVTQAEGNIIKEIAGEEALKRLTEAVALMQPEERELAAAGIHVGIAVDEHKAEFGLGDFLIRHFMGADPDSGAVAVGDQVIVGQTVQFHVRDAAAAHEELRGMLESVRQDYRSGEAKPAGALMFTCNGRGTSLFGAPDHDASTLQSLLGPTQVAGMFCNGEIGPVGRRNFLHGFTCSLAIFRGEPR